MTDQDKATARPWKVYHESGSLGSGGHWGIESAPQLDSPPRAEATRSIARMMTQADGPEARHNARLIVRAVNRDHLFEEMRAIIKDVAFYECDCDLPEAGESGVIKCRGCQARALLARIEKDGGA